MSPLFMCFNVRLGFELGEASEPCAWVGVKALLGVDADTDHAEPREDVESFVGRITDKSRLGCWYEGTLGGGTDVHVEGPGR